MVILFVSKVRKDFYLGKLLFIFLIINVFYIEGKGERIFIVNSSLSYKR